MGQRLLRLSADLLVGVFQKAFSEGPPRWIQATKDALPEDVQIVDMRIEFDRNVLTFKLESAEWPESVPGCAIDHIDPMLSETLLPSCDPANAAGVVGAWGSISFLAEIGVLTERQRKILAADASRFAGGYAIGGEILSDDSSIEELIEAMDRHKTVPVVEPIKSAEGNPATKLVAKRGYEFL